MTDVPERPDSPPESPKNPPSPPSGPAAVEPSKSPYDATTPVKPVSVVFPQDPNSTPVRWFRTKRVVGRILGPACILGGIVAVIWLATTLDVRPRTLDAAVRANTVGIAPHVSGPIVDLKIVDNQPVSRGDVLFTIDPRPYAANLADTGTSRNLMVQIVSNWIGGKYVTPPGGLQIDNIGKKLTHRCIYICNLEQRTTREKNMKNGV